jgi:hypothetical protein
MKNRRKSRSHPSIARVLDDKSSLIEIPSLQYLIMGWKILRNRNPIPPFLHYWMKSSQKSKSHPFNTWLLDEKSSEIEIPSLQYWIMRWKILVNRNPIPSILDYGMKNPKKSKSHPSIARVLDEKSSLIEIPSLQYLIMWWKILRNRNPIPPFLHYWMKNPQKSKSHPFNTGLCDEKFSLIEIPSLQYLIIGWKILINRNPIPSILDYAMKNSH